MSESVTQLDREGTNSASVEPRAQPELTVFLPAYNEAGVIEEVLSGFYDEVVLPTGAELLVCEDGSTDGTDEVLRGLASKFSMRVVQGRSRKGYADACREGLRQVRSPLTFFADSDGQYDPKDFWKLWPYAKDYDMVVGLKTERDEEFYRIFLSRGFHVLTKALTSVPLQDLDCGFRMIRREVIDEVLPEANSLRYSFWAEFTIIAYHKGFRVLEVPVSHHSRPQGITATYTPRRLPSIVRHQFLGITALGPRLRRMPRRS